MLELARRWRYVVGVVGWVPLSRPDEAARAMSALQISQIFVGVRHLIHEDPDPD